MTDIEPLKRQTSESKIKGADIDLNVYREEVRKLVEQVVRLLVDHPEGVSVETYVGPKTTVYRVNCTAEDLGQVIGSQGKTVMGLRAIVHAMTARNGVRSIVEIPV